MRNFTRLVALALGALALSSCTYVPTDSAPQPVNKHLVPFSLLDRHNPPIPSLGHATNLRRTVWFISDHQRLVPTTRLVTLPAGLADVLQTLLDGPSDQENIRGITTALPKRIRVTGATDSNGVLVVQLAGGLRTGPSEILAVAQLILTAANTEDHAVKLVFDGQALKLPRPNKPASYVVQASDYASLEAR